MKPSNNSYTGHVTIWNGVGTIDSSHLGSMLDTKKAYFGRFHMSKLKRFFILNLMLIFNVNISFGSSSNPSINCDFDIVYPEEGTTKTVSFIIKNFVKRKTTTKN